jgi:hypothetical protein
MFGFLSNCPWIYSILWISQWFSLAFLTLQAVSHRLEFMIEKVFPITLREVLFRISATLSCDTSIVISLLYYPIVSRIKIITMFCIDIIYLLQWNYCMFENINFFDTSFSYGHDYEWCLSGRQERRKEVSNASGFNDIDSYHLFRDTTWDLPRRKIDFVTFENAVISKWAQNSSPRAIDLCKNNRSSNHQRLVNFQTTTCERCSINF